LGSHRWPFLGHYTLPSSSLFVILLSRTKTISFDELLKHLVEHFVGDLRYPFTDRYVILQGTLIAHNVLHILEIDELLAWYCISCICAFFVLSSFYYVALGRSFGLQRTQAPRWALHRSQGPYGSRYEFIKDFVELYVGCLRYAYCDGCGFFIFRTRTPCPLLITFTCQSHVAVMLPIPRFRAISPSPLRRARLLRKSQGSPWIVICCMTGCHQIYDSKPLPRGRLVKSLGDLLHGHTPTKF